MRTCALVLCFLAVGASAFTVETNWGGSWSSCGGPNDILQDIEITITPNPPKIGETVTIDASGTNSEEVTAATAQVTVDLLGVPVINKSINLCTIGHGVTCPIPAGHRSIKVSQKIPSSIPKGDYTAKAVITNQNGAEVACLKGSLDLE